jgi:predicted N-formylglutamate amidohydrolase
MHTLIITCEHGGNRVPPEYASLFAGEEEVLASHRGWDPGALEMARHIAKACNAPLHDQQVTRLLVEMNRSLEHPQLFSSFSENLPVTARQQLLDTYYFPYRNLVEEAVHSMPKPVLHISMHTFTPVWNGVPRGVDVGILLDETRAHEWALGEHWQAMLKILLPDRSIVINEPYNGADDGFTTALRKKFPGNEYLGIEVEVNQKFINTPDHGVIQSALARSLRQLVLA